MARLDNIFQDSKSPAEYSKNYFNYLSDVFAQMDNQHIENFINLIVETSKKGKRIFLIGNGGSAATASHWANDLSHGIRFEVSPFKATALNDSATLTCLANDEGFDTVFARQLSVQMADGDIVIAITGSGNSPNLVKAVEYAKSRGNHTVGILGFDGGKLIDMVDSYILVPTEKGEYGPVEDIHMILDHLTSNYLHRLVKNNRL